MAKKIEKHIVRSLSEGGKRVGYAIWCEGCQEAHQIYTTSPNRWNAVWKFNGNMEAPTFEPSLKVMSGHYADRRHPCWCDYHKRPDAKPDAPKCALCHIIITNGRVQYLADCTHKLAGQTRPLIPF